ncbi:YhcH/YjgK/YiaL family protein [Thiohalomonas denitrificans]|uniref:YhcH/YjgK/YiaL family protein n=1 Tax=Thiohalomonas denitrificans TaxID=415747 RepID=UPI0026F19B4C|nr:YhcH/YjgK/YiaL family protein [Thiohalomonas denitrificans]
MILDTLANAHRYHCIHPRFTEAFAFLHADPASLARGRHDIAGDELFAIVSQEDGRPRDEARLECHRRYIDIQYIVAGVDEMGWKPTSVCTRPRGEYSAGKDILFFEDRPEAWVATPAGGFCIFFPEDAHAPLVSPHPIGKIVLKVAV